jgi:hypothetical protein
MSSSLDGFSDIGLNVWSDGAMAAWEPDLVTELERIGEADVRARLARGEFGMVGSSKSRAVQAWLNSKESERRVARENKALSISEEAHSIARKVESITAETLANSRDAMSISRLAEANSRRANAIAIIAMACSVMAILAAVIVALYK